MGAVSFTAFSALASELGVVIIVPFFEKRTAGIYHNSAYIIDTDGKQAGKYRKMHIPDDPHFYEKFYPSKDINILKKTALHLDYHFKWIDYLPHERHYYYGNIAILR